MTSSNKDKPGPKPQEPLPSTGEGADSALDVLKKKRPETPPADASLPLTPPKDKR